MRTAGEDAAPSQTSFICCVSLMLLSPSSPCVDISSALRSIVLKSTWDLEKIFSGPKMFLMSGPEEENLTLSPLNDRTKSAKG